MSYRPLYPVGSPQEVDHRMRYYTAAAVESISEEIDSAIRNGWDLDDCEASACVEWVPTSIETPRWIAKLTRYYLDDGAPIAVYAVEVLP